ncbi:MAG: VOC family protein [Bryobacteraceae bacterium]|jgi:glyoxalase-like protein
MRSRRLLSVALVPALMAAADLKVDHVTVAGSDLKKLQASLAGAGIETVYGGPHSNGATEMALVSFPDGSYLELIAPQPHADAHALTAHTWVKFMKEDAGPCAWAVRAADVAAEAKRLLAAGIAVTPPLRNGRLRPDGVRLDWETAQVGTEPNGTFFPFLIHDFTPREQRAFPQGKPSNKDFAGVTKVVIAVHDLEAAIKQYRQAYELPAAIKQVDTAFGAHLAILGAAPVVLAQPLTQDGWLAQRLAQFGEGPCAFVLSQRRGRPQPASETRWFGVKISWFDAKALGWRLGYEPVER